MENKFIRNISQDALVSEKTDIVFNSLLGVYDNNGNYFIAPEIINELISFEKAKKYAFQDSVFCESNIPGFGEIMFEISFHKNPEKNEFSAKLFLLENVYKINGYLQNTIKTLISEFKSDMKDFVEKVYKNYNVVVVYDENGRKKKVSAEHFLKTFLMAKKQYCNALKNAIQTESEKLYGDYYKAKMKVLNRSNNAFNADVLRQYDNEYKKIEGVFLKERKNKDLNELLDKSIEDITQTKEQNKEFEEKFFKEILPALKTFYSSMTETIETASKKVMESLDKSDRLNMNVIKEKEDNFVRTSNNDSSLSELIDLLNLDQPILDENELEMYEESLKDLSIENSVDLDNETNQTTMQDFENSELKPIDADLLNEVNKKQKEGKLKFDKALSGKIKKSILNNSNFKTIDKDEQNSEYEVINEKSEDRNKTLSDNLEKNSNYIENNNLATSEVNNNSKDKNTESSTNDFEIDHNIWFLS